MTQEKTLTLTLTVIVEVDTDLISNDDYSQEEINKGFEIYNLELIEHLKQNTEFNQGAFQIIEVSVASSS
jgi:hypothetical protein